MATGHWNLYPGRRPLMAPPLRPHADVIERMRALIGDIAGPVLLLGVTRDLAVSFRQVHAVDRSPAMVERSWPGDTGARRATVGDWLEIDPAGPRYAGIVGDGSLNMLTPQQIGRLLVTIVGLLEPGARFACRLFERPTPAFTEADLARSTSTPGLLNFTGFKWQLAMHLAAELGTSLHVVDLRAAFDSRCADRDALARATGWTREAIDTIDLYIDSPLAYSFPDRAEFEALLPPGVEAIEFQPCGSYDLAACCPILTFRKPVA